MRLVAASAGKKDNGVKKQRKERREHWIGVAREFAAITMWGILIFLFIVFVAPHLP